MITKQIFDYLVIGGGSGGLGSARRAASYGAKVAVVESDRLGGTCVIRGCVPKKVTYNLCQLLDSFHHDAARYGCSWPGSSSNGMGKEGGNGVEVPYDQFKRMRDAYVTRLNTLYHGLLEKEKISFFHGWASFPSSPSSSSTLPLDDPPNTETVTWTETEDASSLIPLMITPMPEEDPKETNRSRSSSSPYLVYAKKVLIATGGKPYVPLIPGIEHADTSDTFFEWTSLPSSVMIVGTGYIGVELSGMLHGLGCQVHLCSRSSTLLRSFDSSLQERVLTTYTRQLGIQVSFQVTVTRIEKTTSPLNHLEKDPLLTIHYEVQGEPKQCTTQRIVFATGRVPNVDRLNLPPTIQRTSLNHVCVDDFQNTHASNIYALGDVCGKAELTPVALAAGRALADRLFGPHPHAKLDYSLIPTVVFSHPPLGTVGLTEHQARQRYPASDLKIYTSTFVNMYYALPGLEGKLTEKPSTFYKMICLGPEEKVIGLHLFGKSSDEILQGFAVAIKMGARKRDFDQTIAIHPTAAEELVTMR